jgi:putative Holliday junction resolvase
LKVLALDFGSARTGVAVSDPTGTVARPVTTIERAVTEGVGDHLGDELAPLERRHHDVLALEDPVEGRLHLVGELLAVEPRAALEAPVETYDERFTSILAGGDDARAAAHLLSSYLERQSAGR